MSQRLELFFWTAFPSLISFIFLLLSQVPKHMSGLGNVMPLLMLMPLFYWGLNNSRDMPYWFAFVLGLLMDAATNAPLGLTSLLNLMLLLVVRSQRRFFQKEGFVLIWAFFSFLLGLLILCQWLAMGVVTGKLVPFFPMVVQWLLSVVCYPLFHRLFDVCFTKISERRWHILHD